MSVAKRMAALVLAGSLASVCTGLQADTIRVAMPGDMRSTNYGVNRDGNTDTVLHHVVEALVAYREDLSVGPLLAREWQVSDDGLEYTFTLRDGARFHNGEPVTADEVVWSWNRFLDEDTGYLCKSWYDGSGNTGIEITDIEALDEATVRFTLAEPNGLFLARMAHLVCLTGIVHPDSVSDDGEWREPIGTGPFTIAEWRRGEYVELERFEDYAPLDEPMDGYAGSRETLVDRARFVILSDPAASKIALQSGDIDILPRLDLNAIPEIESASELEVQTVSTPEWQVMMLQNTDPVLDDVNLRRAISHAIDRAALTDGATVGLGAPNPSAAAVDGTFHDTTFGQGLEYSVEKAREFVEQSDYDGSSITLTTNTRFPFDEISAIAVQSMLQAAGIRAELEVLDWSTQFTKYREGDFQMMIMGFSARTDPTLMMDVVVDSKENRDSAIVDDPEIIELVRRSGAESDPEQRRALLHEAHRKMVDDASLIGFFNPARAVGVHQRVEGFELWPLEKTRLWGVSLDEG